MAFSKKTQELVKNISKEEVEFINRKVSASFTLLSIALMYLEEAVEAMLKYNLCLPFLKTNYKIIESRFTIIKVELNKLMDIRGTRREFAEDTLEVSEKTDEIFGFDK